jgi:hypothetical protein
MGRRGPKAKTGYNREGSGRLSRKPADLMQRVNGALEMEERETLRPGVEARVRLHGLEPEVSRDQRAGSFAGRLCMSGEITTTQYEAAMIYLEDHRNNLMAIRAPRDPSGVDLNRVQGGSGDAENVEFYRRATTRWRDATKAVQERQNELRGGGALIAALDTCLVRDAECHHMVGWLREGLNSLVRHYGLGGERSRAA